MITPNALATLGNCEQVRLGEIPGLDWSAFRSSVLDVVEQGGRVSALFACPAGEGHEIYAVLADDVENGLCIARTRVTGGSFESMTPACPQVHLFEREIFEQHGLEPIGHPWLKPVRFPNVKTATNGSLPLNKGGLRGGSGATIGITDYYQIEGEEIHEVAVGPVHAGIIEPGHFRFQCHGETVFHLEISLGYQHRGIERMLPGGPDKRTVFLMEQAAGDTTIGHTTAYCQAVEALSGSRIPARAQVLRGIALELERLANHTGDLGALANDVGYLPTASYCGRLRGDFLNMTALICGNRFGRGLIRPAGVAFDLDAARADELQKRLTATFKDVENAVNLLWDSPSVMARFEETGRVSLEMCNEIGLVGLAARACGAARDVRQDFPAGIYCFGQLPVSTWHTGDVFARAYVRWLEIQQSVKFIQDQLHSLPGGAVKNGTHELKPDSLVVSLVEGWRGEICHVAMTGPDARLRHYKVVDPSFHNWTGLAMALRDQQISDFPLCNKSFNLSYCGYDL